MEILIKKTRPEATIPTKGTEGAAGWDLYAADEPSINGGWKLLKYDTGISIVIPKGYFGQIAPRSSIYKTYLRQANQPGIIDSDYRGPISFVFDYIGPNIAEMSSDEFQQLFEDKRLYKAGDRIGQLILLPYETQEYKLVNELPNTTRGTGGFGSTGK